MKKAIANADGVHDLFPLFFPAQIECAAQPPRTAWLDVYGENQRRRKESLRQHETVTSLGYWVVATCFEIHMKATTSNWCLYNY